MNDHSSDAYFYYLTEVLGVRHFVSPLVLAPAPAVAFFVYSPFELSADEHVFVNKMLAAIQVNEPHYISQSGQKEAMALIEKAAAHSAGFGVSFGLTPPAMTGFHWLELPAVSQFVDDSNASRRDSVKRSAWEKLKKLKGEMTK